MPRVVFEQRRARPTDLTRKLFRGGDRLGKKGRQYDRALADTPARRRERGDDDDDDDARSTRVNTRPVQGRISYREGHGPGIQRMTSFRVNETFSRKALLLHHVNVSTGCRSCVVPWMYPTCTVMLLVSDDDRSFNFIYCTILLITIKKNFNFFPKCAREF